MSVYVDRLQPAEPYHSPVWPYREFCHLWADTLEELHHFARAIDLRKAWFQDRPGFPHYDLTAGRRQAALERGATEMDVKTWLAVRRKVSHVQIP